MGVNKDRDKVNPNAGGNTSSSRKSLQNISAKSQMANDVMTLNHTETFANPANLMCDEPYLADQADRQFGYPYNIADLPENQEDTQGNGGWTVAGPGPGISQAMTVPGSKDPTPGGGWE